MSNFIFLFLVLLTPSIQRGYIHLSFFFSRKSVKNIICSDATIAQPHFSLSGANAPCVTPILAMTGKIIIMVDNAMAAVTNHKFLEQHDNSLSAPVGDFNPTSLFWLLS